MVTADKNKQVSFYIFGDSICFGQLISPHLSWVNHLSNSLSNVNNDRQNMLVQNASVNGNTTRNALERMSYDITSHKPDFMMVQFGMNDCNYWVTDNGKPRVSKKCFATNLEEIIDRGLANNVKHVILNTNHPSLLGKFQICPDYSHSESNAEYNEIIRATYNSLISNNYPLTLIDVEKLWKNFFEKNKMQELKEYLLEDKIHLSKNGHDLYIKLVNPIVISTLSKFSN